MTYGRPAQNGPQVTKILRTEVLSQVFRNVRFSSCQAAIFRGVFADRRYSYRPPEKSQGFDSLVSCGNHADRSNRDARSRRRNGAVVFEETGAAMTGRLANGYNICANCSPESIRSSGFLAKHEAIISSNRAGSEG